MTADDRARQQAASDSLNFTPHSVTETHTVLVSDVDDIATVGGPLIVTEAAITYHRGEDGHRRVTARVGGTLREKYDAGCDDTFGHRDYPEAADWPDWLAGLAWDYHPEPYRLPDAIPAPAADRACSPWQHAGGEPCDDCERRQAHAEGEHAFCGPECTEGTSDSTAAVAAFLGHPRLAALLTTGEQRQQVLEVRDVIGCDDLARAFLIGMNPALYDESPLAAIADGHGAAAIKAAKEAS